MEQYLAQEITKELPMPDGSKKPFTADRLLWTNVEYLDYHFDIDLEELVKISLMDCEELGYPIEKTFPNTVAYVRSEFDKQFPANSSVTHKQDLDSVKNAYKSPTSSENTLLMLDEISLLGSED